MNVKRQPLKSQADWRLLGFQQAEALLRSTHISVNQRGSSPDETRFQHLLWHLHERHLYAERWIVNTATVLRGHEWMVTSSSKPFRDEC